MPPLTSCSFSLMRWTTILAGMGDVLKNRGDLAAARKSYEEALALRKEMGEPQLIAETELALGRLDIEEGRAADGEAVIRKCNEQFHHENQSDDELDSSVGLMEAWLSENKPAAAEKQRRDSQDLADRSAYQLLRLQFDIVSARSEASAGDDKSANLLLQRTLSKAHAGHLFGIELETRLALAELKQQAGRRAQAQSDLLALGALASRKGFGMIASKSASLRK